MARWWKKQAKYRYSYVIHSDGTQTKITHYYRVAVCSFTFTFHSPEEIPRYIAYYETKILPSSRVHNYNVRGYGDHEECQRWYERLPLRLRDGAKRQKVVDALKRAHADFLKQDGKRNR